MAKKAPRFHDAAILHKSPSAHHRDQRRFRTIFYGESGSGRQSNRGREHDKERTMRQGLPRLEKAPKHDLSSQRPYQSGPECEHKRDPGQHAHKGLKVLEANSGIAKLFGSRTVSVNIHNHLLLYISTCIVYQSISENTRANARVPGKCIFSVTTLPSAGDEWRTMANSSDYAAIFDPAIRQWFASRFPAPTSIQTKAWPAIAAGRHVLITAPTGAGKTLTAFLWGINQLITGAWTRGGVRVLYVSPLKALNADIRENLLQPLSQIREACERLGRTVVMPRTATRSGDTPQRERARMIKNPPEILITTPESLNLILDSPRARDMLRGIQTVILDEIHAVAGAKRGVYCMAAVERLTLLAGEFQRIAISATVKPLNRAAAFVGGFSQIPQGSGTRRMPRPVRIIEAEQTKRIRIEMRNAGMTGEGGPGGDSSPWTALAEKLRTLIAEHTATLIFVNSRRMAEKLAMLINEQAGETLAYSHHGSLSKEIRAVVEGRLRKGKLAGIVATSSLELGIDIGNLDQVVLVQSPHSVSAALQRIGRSGHAVDRESCGVVFPTHGMDSVYAAALADMIRDRDIEELRPIERPLDILTQVVLAMSALDEWNLDELYEFVQCIYSFAALERKQFDAVCAMLAGRYEASRIRELQSRVLIDADANTIRAKAGALQLVYSSGGTIPDRGYYGMRLKSEQRAKVGELDEEFVWERRVGDRFALGAQSWKITRIDHKDVEVVPWSGPLNTAPFWRAERINRDFHYSERISRLLNRWNDQIGREDLSEQLAKAYPMDNQSAERLARFLQRQRAALGVPLPHRRHVVVEHFVLQGDESGAQRTLIHTFWGSRVHMPYALALQAAWRKRSSVHVDFMPSNDCIYADGFVSAADIVSLVTAASIESFLRVELEGSGYFGARFRENAGRALLLPRGGPRRRMPLWVNRRRAKNVFESVRGYADFPLIAETWRTCLLDEFDLDSLRMLLDEIGDGAIAVSEVFLTTPSPFAADVLWQVTNQFMYEDDASAGAGGTSLDDEMIAEIVHGAGQRPRISGALVREFQDKLQRVFPGYAPRGGLELLDWVRERVCVSFAEWTQLLEASVRDSEKTLAELTDTIRERIVRIAPPGAGEKMITTIELLPRLACALDSAPAALQPLTAAPGTLPANESGFTRPVAVAPESILHGDSAPMGFAFEEVLAEWLTFYGPLPYDDVIRRFGDAVDDDVVGGLIESGIVIEGELTDRGRVREICDSENFQRLLRLSRLRARPSFEPLPVASLPLFLASWQGICGPEPGEVGLKRALEQLMGYSARAILWERDIFPVRIKEYRGRELDHLLRGADLEWVGAGNERLFFRFAADADLFDYTEGNDDADSLAPELAGKYTFDEIVAFQGANDPRDTAARLWRAVWNGELTADTFEPLRQGLHKGFQLHPVQTAGGGRRRAVDRWRPAQSIAGNWYRPRRAPTSGDSVEQSEREKDRARTVLARYGVVFRELLVQEPPALRWASVFRALRLMELSGEIVAGRFFSGPSGIQFASRRAFRALRAALPEDAFFSMNAADPASCCGIDIQVLRRNLPARSVSNGVLYHGSCCIGVIKQNGKRIEMRIDAGDERSGRVAHMVRGIASREAFPVNPVRVEKINEAAALLSPYRDAFYAAGFVADHKGLSYWAAP